MSFPTDGEYNEALQHPETSIKDSQLSRGRMHSNAFGPIGRSGQFALTYKVAVGAKDFAFRVFRSERPGMHERYSAISAHLSSMPLPYFVDFSYMDPGITVLGTSYPAIKMAWAEGVTLGTFIDEHHADQGRMRALQQQLHGMALTLENTGIAHGDVQSNNVIIGAGGDIQLVDYDGMFVPALKSMGHIEFGHRNFQHPERLTVQPYGPTLDRFSFILIHAVLSALIEDPSLWNRLDSHPDELLLGATDFANPDGSAKFAALIDLANSGSLFTQLRAICLSSYPSIPSFSDFLSGRNIPQVAAAAQRPRTAAQTTGSGTNGASAAWYESYIDSSDSLETVPELPAGVSITGSGQQFLDGSNYKECAAAADGVTVRNLAGKVTGYQDIAGEITLTFMRNGLNEVSLVVPREVAHVKLDRGTPLRYWNRSWVRATGVVNMKGKKALMRITNADDLQMSSQKETESLIGAGTAAAPVTEKKATTSNADLVAGLGVKPAGIGTPRGSSKSNNLSWFPPNTYKAPKEREVPMAIVWILTIVAVIILITVLVVAAIQTQTAYNGSSDSGVTESGVIADRSLPASYLVEDCVEINENNDVTQVSCGGEKAQFRVVRSSSTASGCKTLDTKAWTDGNYLCLDPISDSSAPSTASALGLTTCVIEDGVELDCKADSTDWVYTACWVSGEDIELQAWDESAKSWSYASTLTPSRDSSRCKDSDFPYLMEIASTVNPLVGQHKFRLIPGNNDNNVYYFKVDVSRSSP